MEPRYYDPVKEEIEKREKLIIAEINAEKKKGTYQPGTRISSAFSRSKPKKDDSSLLRFLFAILLFGGVVGYMYFGQLAVYTAFGLGLASIFVFKWLNRS